MGRWVILLAVVVSVAAIARGAVYGSGSAPASSPLQGYVLLSAFTGGLALAFSRPFLLVLVPYLTVLSGGLTHDGYGRRIGWGPSGSYLGAFAAGFAVTISGFPSAVGTPIYGSERLVDLAGGTFFLAWGLLAVFGLLPRGPAHSGAPAWRHVGGSVPAALLGVVTGLLMYHELDPVYDSVFFLTANAVPASHAPVTVAVFGAAVGLAYLAAGSAAVAMAARVRWRRRILLGLGARALSGMATAGIGLSILSDQFGVVRRLLF